jgi:hypothetical protein
LARRSWLRLCRGINPAGVNPSAQALRHLGIDLIGKTHQATERRLDVAAGTAKPVIQIQMAKRRIEVVPPHQYDHSPAKPNAFGVSRGTIDGLLRFDKLVGLALVFLGSIGGVAGPWFGLLILSANLAALREGASDTKQQGQHGDRKVAQRHRFTLNHASMHRFPDLLPCRRERLV